VSRFLLLPHAPTSGLAHVGACLAVGEELRERGHEVLFGYGGTKPEVIERQGFPWRRVPEVSPDREWSRDGWFESPGQLLRAVRSHQRLIEELSPDAAVSSSGLAGRLACEAAEIPQVHLMHYVPLSGYGRRAIVWGDRLRDARHPRRAARVLRARVRRIWARRSTHGREVRIRTREALGLGPAGDRAWGNCRDTVVALTTTPFLDPALGLPPHWRYIGPITWSVPVDAAPPRRGNRPLAYVTQGSTGDPDLLRRAVAELAGAPLDVVASTGGLCEPRELERSGSNVRAAEYLPGRACIEAADVAVIHGGHLTLCEALVAGTPVVVLPCRGDQWMRINSVERLGVGAGVWPRPLLPGGTRRAVRGVLESERHRTRAAEVSRRLRADWDGPRNAAGLLERLAGGERA
jgi:UDP:flavonoid glycosyltransferase YjiC (YdhE family)